MMNLMRVLWALYRGPSKDPKHQARIVPVTTNELPRQSKLQERFWRLFWRLYFRSSRVPLKVFRVRRDQGSFCGTWIVYNDPARSLFVARSYHGNPPVGSKIRELRDMEDAWGAVDSLCRHPSGHLDSWEPCRSNSVHEACDRFDAMCQEVEEEEELEELTVDQTAEDASDVRGDGDVADTLAAQDAGTLATQDPLEHDYDFEELARERLREIRKMAHAKEVHWKPIDPTPDGRECDILVIDGREIHRL